MSTIFVFALLVVGTFAATVMPPDHHGHDHHGHQHPHPTDQHHMGHIEGETFMMDPHTNTLMAKTAGKCYLYKLSDDEQANYEHTSAGLHALEKKIIDLIDAGSATTLGMEEVHKLGFGVNHFCHHSAVMSLN